MKRIAYIDSIKGFAILLVVMGHTFHDFKGINMAFIDFIYAFHMPLFFIISGYLGYKKYYDINQSLFYYKIHLQVNYYPIILKYKFLFH